MSSSRGNDWGEEVMPGIYVMRKRPAPPSVNGVIQEGDAPLDFQQIYQDIDSVTESIKCLERSNQEMLIWLDEAWQEVLGSTGREPDLSKHPRPPTGVDHDVEEAIVENIDLLRIKYKRLESLKALVSMHHCTQHDHDHTPPAIPASSWATAPAPMAAPASQPMQQTPANAETVRRTLPTVGAPGMSVDDEYGGDDDLEGSGTSDQDDGGDEESKSEGAHNTTAQAEAPNHDAVQSAAPVAKSSAVIYL